MQIKTKKGWIKGKNKNNIIKNNINNNDGVAKAIKKFIFEE